jgi:hypothetical protein
MDVDGAVDVASRSHACAAAEPIGQSPDGTAYLFGLRFGERRERYGLDPAFASVLFERCRP